MARIAAAQHGVVTLEQLGRCGLDREAVRRRVAAGRLHRIHRGVYAVGHGGLTTDGRYLASVFACGDGAVLSHGAAAHLLRLVRGAAPAPEVSTTRARRVRGVVVHRPNALHPLEVSTYAGIPVTTVPRTLVDLASRLSLADLARACHNAHVLHRTTPPMIEAVIARAPNRRGMATLKQALLGDDLLLSDLEEGFLALLRSADLPLPRTNIRRAEGLVDCHWPALDLTVELASYRFHATRHQFEKDVRRARATARHATFTWGDVFERPRQTLTELEALLMAR